MKQQSKLDPYGQQKATDENLESQRLKMAKSIADKNRKMQSIII